MGASFLRKPRYDTMNVMVVFAGGTPDIHVLSFFIWMKLDAFSCGQRIQNTIGG